jgi:hypothetical protein
MAAVKGQDEKGPAMADETNEQQMTDKEWYDQFGDCITAALETCAAKRWVATGTEWEEERLIPRATRTADIVATASAKIEARDPRALHEIFATQAAVLDEIFTQFAGMAAKDPESFKTSMAIALKAQSQCRWTLKAILAMDKPSPARAAESQDLCGQTIENGKAHA